MQDIYRGIFISVANRIRKRRIKGYMVKLKVLLQVFWERVFMDTYKNICTYYTLRGQEDNYGDTIIETSFREIMRNCINLIKE